MEKDIGPLPSFELLSQNTLFRIDKQINIVDDLGNVDGVCDDNVNNLENVDCGEKDGSQEKKDGAEVNEGVEDNDDCKGKKKHIRPFFNRCYPKRIIDIFEKIKSEEQVDRMNGLKTIGFFGMTQLRIHHVHTDLIQWVCDNFISTKLKISLGEEKFLSLKEEDIDRVYRLPRGNRRIELSTCTKEEMVRLKDELEVMFYRTSKELVPLADIRKKLESYESDVTWKKAVVLCFIGYVLCPPSNGLITLRYADCLKNLNELHNYNWCEHILNYLQKGIKKKVMYPSGDFHFLMVHVMDNIKGNDRSDGEPSCAK